ncbi:MAG: hypothetical protein AAGD22_11250 [Verrucomicrobiota bacterium]
MNATTSTTLTLSLILPAFLLASPATASPDPDAAAQQLRTEIDASVNAFLTQYRPSLPAPRAADTIVQETVDREVEVAATGSGERPQTLIQFFKRKKQSSKEQDRAAGIQSTMAVTNAQTQRELAIALLTETKSDAFDRIKQDLLWRSTIDENTNLTAVNLLDNETLTQLIYDYWWASTRLDALQ